MSSLETPTGSIAQTADDTVSDDGFINVADDGSVNVPDDASIEEDMTEGIGSYKIIDGVKFVKTNNGYLRHLGEDLEAEEDLILGIVYNTSNRTISNDGSNGFNAGLNGFNAGLNGFDAGLNGFDPDSDAFRAGLNGSYSGSDDGSISENRHGLGYIADGNVQDGTPQKMETDSLLRVLRAGMFSTIITMLELILKLSQVPMLLVRFRVLIVLPRR
jgi:hypothetical protein